MYVKSHTDVPALFRLLGTMKEENGGGAVSVDLQDHAPMVRPPEWNRWHTMMAKAQRATTETVFEGLYREQWLADSGFADVR